MAFRYKELAFQVGKVMVWRTRKIVPSKPRSLDYLFDTHLHSMETLGLPVYNIQKSDHEIRFEEIIDGVIYITAIEEY